MGQLSVHPRARADLDNIADFIATGSIDAALRFYDAARRAFRLLADMPGLGTGRPSQNPSLRDLRTWPIKGFRNYLVCYLRLADGIEVLRVLHGARDLAQIFELA